MSKKIFGLVALFAAVVLFAGANTVKAATAQELQDQINALLAQIGSLQGGSSTSCYSFTRDLTVGSQGADVTALQNYLAAKGYFNVAATGYFGAITAQAAAAWQSANGVMPAAGYFGAISRAKYNSMCSSTTPTTGDDDDDDSDSDFGGSDGEEASLEDFDVKDGDDTSIEEGQEDAEAMEIEFDVEDSDVEVQRVEVVASSSAGNGEEDPWDVFESATLWMDGDDVATVEDLDDEDNWDEQTTDGQFSFRFNGVDTVVGEGETAEFVVSFTFQDNLDELDESWDLWIDDEGIRALDEAGIDQYTGDDSDIVTIDLEAAGGDDELTLSESSENPEASTLEVEEDEKSEWLSLAIMELEADTDTEVKDFKFRVLINEAGADTEDYEDVVSDLVLIIDGEEYDDFSVSGADTATATITFDLDGEDIVIAEGEEVAVEVQAEFLATTTGAYDEGTTVTVDVPSTTFEAIDAEGVDSGEDLEAAQLEGSFEGEVMTLRSEGVSVVAVSDDAERTFIADDTGESDQGTFTLVFEVTAFGEDVYIDNSTPAEDNDGSEVTTSASYSVSNPGNNTSVGVLSATGGDYDDETNSWKIAEGDTAEFTLEVIVTATSSSNAFVTLQALGYAFTDVDGTHVLTVPDESGFKTDAINLLDL
ncbi:MAG: trimeric autotransporter adhesin [Candidatus Parcubacteria bacterium]|jgi:peptidoglycan hydrolase-like protein with peptidoglycan-binding domain